MLQSIKKSAQNIKESSLFWSYPVYNKILTSSPSKEKTEDDIDFPDPKYYLIGFVCKVKAYKKTKSIAKRPLTSAS